MSRIKSGMRVVVTDGCHTAELRGLRGTVKPWGDNAGWYLFYPNPKPENWTCDFVALYHNEFEKEETK